MKFPLSLIVRNAEHLLSGDSVEEIIKNVAVGEAKTALTKEVQKHLNKTGANLLIDGDYGSKTDLAFKAFERSHPNKTVKNVVRELKALTRELEELL